MDTACQNGPQNDPEIDDRSPQRPLERPGDRAQSGDIQKLDQKNLFVVHGNIVHAILQSNRGGWPVIRRKDLINKLAVGHVADDEQDNTDQKCNHTRTPPLTLGGIPHFY